MNSNKPPWGLIRDGGLFIQSALGVGAYSRGGGLIKGGLNRGFTVCMVYVWCMSDVTKSVPRQNLRTDVAINIIFFNRWV